MQFAKETGSQFVLTNVALTTSQIVQHVVGLWIVFGVVGAAISSVRCPQDHAGGRGTGVRKHVIKDISTNFGISHDTVELRAQNKPGFHVGFQVYAHTVALVARLFDDTRIVEVPE